MLTSNNDQLLAEVEKFSLAEQPDLDVYEKDGFVVIEGVLLVNGAGGPFDCFNVVILVSKSFPTVEPVVFETNKRIPKTPDRHINQGDGSCCLGVWEEWLLQTTEPDFSSFMRGPVNDYFVSQCWYEVKNEWPYGHRSHGQEGVVEAFCDILGVEVNKEKALSYLRLLSMKSIKGHHICPCGSGLRLRDCHYGEIVELSEKISPGFAFEMMKKLKG